MKTSIQVNMRKLLLPLMASAILIGTGCKEESSAEKAGKELDKAAENAKDSVNKAADKTGDALKDAGNKLKDATK